MLNMAEKAEIISKLHARKGEEAIRLTLDLVDILINDARIDNDTASPDSVLTNQGEIRGLARLKECITRGIPGK